MNCIMNMLEYGLSDNLETLISIHHSYLHRNTGVFLLLCCFLFKHRGAAVRALRTVTDDESAYVKGLPCYS